MEKPKISVIIPIYNVEMYLKECLNSVVNQTFKDIEIICVDDCGSDSSMTIVKEFAKNDSRIKIVHHSCNLGLGPARNTGMDSAIGDYIFFLDSDDYIKEDILEKLYNHAQETNSDIIISESEAFSENNDHKTIKRLKGIYNDLKVVPFYNYCVAAENITESIDNIFTSAWGKLYSTDFLKKNNIRFIQKNIIYEDNNFFIKILSNFPKISFIKEVGVIYRISDNSITGRLSKKSFSKTKKFKIMMTNLNDAFKYIKENKTKQQAELLINKIKISNLYTRFFEKKFGFILKWKFIGNEKYIKLFGIDLFKEKNDGLYKKIRILGFLVYKTFTGTAQEKINYNKYPADLIINSACNLTTNNTNKDMELEFKKLGKFYYIPHAGNLGDCIICSSDYQYFNAKSLEYSIYENTDFKLNPYNIVFSGGGDFYILLQKCL